MASRCREATLPPKSANASFVTAFVCAKGLGKNLGDTVGERIVDDLTATVGVTQEEIDATRDIFLEN